MGQCYISRREIKNGGGIKLNGLVEHTTGSQGWRIKIDGTAVKDPTSECNITYYAVVKGLSIYVQAEDDSNECKFIWSSVKDVSSTYPNRNMIGEPVTDVVNGFVTVPDGANYICFSQRVSDVTTGVYKVDLL